MIWRGPRSVGRELVLARLTPTAAATLIPPAEVLAAGVGSAPAVPLPLWSVEVFAAKLRCAATWRSTPSPAVPPPEGSWGAPAAEACAVAELLDEPCALSETSPAATRSRARVAWLWWLAMVRPSEMPIAAEALWAEPWAVVFALAV